jgi:hypothetical protein
MHKANLRRPKSQGQLSKDNIELEIRSYLATLARVEKLSRTHEDERAKELSSMVQEIVSNLFCNARMVGQEN